MRDFFRRALVPSFDASTPLAPGLYHYVRTFDGAPVRYHLRVEPDGSAVLLANATSALRLSPHGAVAAKALLEGRSVQGAADDMARRFRVPSGGEALASVRGLDARISKMGDPDEAFPMSTLDDPAATLHRRRLSAPLTADVVAPELGNVELHVRKLWDIGVPQVRFVLPYATTGRHLVRLVELAEDLGMIAGVRARASDLVNAGLVRDLAMAGVDHIDIYWAGAGAETHDGLFGDKDHALADAAIEECHALEVCPVAVLPVLDDIVDALDELSDALEARRLRVLVAYAICSDAGEGRVVDAALLAQAATTLEEIAEHVNVNLVWSPPEERDEAMTLVEQVQRGPRTAGEACIRVEPDGSVLAPDGPAVARGDLAADPWESIWASPAFHCWRESVPDPERCARCPGLELCDAGCPSSHATWALAPRAAAPKEVRT